MLRTREFGTESNYYKLAEKGDAKIKVKRVHNRESNDCMYKLTEKGDG